MSLIRRSRRDGGGVRSQPQSDLRRTSVATNIPPPPPRWMQELIDEMNKLASAPLSDEELEQLERPIPPEHELIVDRAKGYCDRVSHWFEVRGFQSSVAPDDPRSVISWFHYSVVAKSRRALRGLAEDDPEEQDWPADPTAQPRSRCLEWNARTPPGSSSSMPASRRLPRSSHSSPI